MCIKNSTIKNMKKKTIFIKNIYYIFNKNGKHNATYNTHTHILFEDSWLI